MSYHPLCEDCGKEMTNEGEDGRLHKCKCGKIIYF